MHLVLEQKQNPCPENPPNHLTTLSLSLGEHTKYFNGVFCSTIGHASCAHIFGHSSDYGRFHLPLGVDHGQVRNAIYPEGVHLTNHRAPRTGKRENRDVTYHMMHQQALIRLERQRGV